MKGQQQGQIPIFPILSTITKYSTLRSISYAMSQQSAWLKLILSSITCWILPATLTTSPALSAERIYLSYGILERSISVNSLETYAKTGKIDQDLAAYTNYVNPQQLAQFREILMSRVPLNVVAISQFLYTPVGERLLERLGTVVQTESRQPGFYAIRAALILAAAQPQGLTVLNVIRKFPSDGVRINLNRGLTIAKALEKLVNQTNQATEAVNQQATLEAQTSPPINAQLPDLRRSGPFQWEKRTITLNDPSRNRIFPADIYLPSSEISQHQSYPVIVISHGLGSDRTSFAYLAKHLASYGFVVAVPQHPGSDTQQLKALIDGRANEVTSPQEFINRPLDVTYLLNELNHLSEIEPAFKGRLNLEQVGVVGQSFGGYTVLALSGATIRAKQLQASCNASNDNDSLDLSLLLQCLVLRLPQPRYNLSDPRVKAEMAIDPVDSLIMGKEGLSQIKIPTMIIAGSADTVAPALPEQIQPFTWLTTLNKYLVLINGGTHFSTIGGSAGAVPVPPNVIGPDPALARSYVNALSVAFFQTYIANRPNYRTYLSAAYAKTISQDPLKLSLVHSLLDSQLAQLLLPTVSHFLLQIPPIAVQNQQPSGPVVGGSASGPVSN